MQNNFSDLGLSPEILKAIGEMGFVEPTEVQSQAIPTILNREDVIVMSKTGSGKTAVFGIPMLQIINPDEEGPQGLILTPTRELAVQIDSDLQQMSKYLTHRTVVVYGQHSINVEVQALKKGASIVTGTPGRVFDHLRQGNLVTQNIRFLVLDEADRMLDMGFYPQVIRIVKALPRNRITLLFSATIPAEVQRISRDFMNNPVMIEIESQTMTVDTVRQVYYRLNRNEKQTQLNRLLLMEQPESCMIFCNTRIAVDHVQSFLSRKGYSVQSLHGDIPQAKRMKTIDLFKEGVFHILVATDVAARGIHIDNLSLVINYDVPLENDGYVHRIGRTGRAGNEGLAITLVTGDDIMSLYEIEEHTGAMISEAELPTDEMLENLKESAEKWIQANSNLLPSDSSIPAGRRSMSENLRGKSGVSAGSSPSRAPRTSPKSSPRASSSPSKNRTPSPSPSRSPSPSPVSSASASPSFSPISSASVSPRPFLVSNSKSTPEAGHESPDFHKNIALRNPSAANAATSPVKDLQTHSRPHVRIVGGSQEESAVSPVLKPPVKRAPSDFAQKEAARKGSPVHEDSHKSAADKPVAGKEAADSKPVVKRLWDRLFRK